MLPKLPSNLAKIVYGSAFGFIVILLAAIFILQVEENFSTIKNSQVSPFRESLESSDWVHIQEKFIKWSEESHTQLQKLNGRFLDQELSLIAWIEALENSLLYPTQQLLQEVQGMDTERKSEKNIILAILNHQVAWYEQMIQYTKLNNEEALVNAKQAKKQWIQRLVQWINQADQVNWIKKSSIRNLTQLQKELQSIEKTESPLVYVMF